MHVVGIMWAPVYNASATLYRILSKSRFNRVCYTLAMCTLSVHMVRIVPTTPNQQHVQNGLGQLRHLAVGQTVTASTPPTCQVAQQHLTKRVTIPLPPLPRRRRLQLQPAAIAHSGLATATSFTRHKTFHTALTPTACVSPLCSLAKIRAH